LKKKKVGIVGYGNLGRGVETAIQQNRDFELAAVITRRNPEEVKINTLSAARVHTNNVLDLKGKVDVMILCGGSATDLPVQGPEFAKNFVTVDSYDTHAKIPEYFEKMDKTSKKAKLISLISAGWDPGLFSINRLMMQSVLPFGLGCSFWGKGVSQGHSDAIRRIEGVENAIQYTMPLEAAIEKARNGESGFLQTRDKHIRECFVVAKEGADKERIENEIDTMPNYFSDYETIIHFISREELEKNHKAMPHGGFVIQSGKMNGSRQTMEFSLKLENNPEFTASVLLAYARAAHRYYKEGRTGALTAFDIPPAYLSPETDDEIRKNIL